jgi:hypothetical protein
MLCGFRDELCRGGDLLHSPALSYTLLHLAAAVEATRQQKLLQEQPEEEAETRSSEDSLRVSNSQFQHIKILSITCSHYCISIFTALS